MRSPCGGATGRRFPCRSTPWRTCFLAGGIAHDFNNILTAITGYAELIVDRLPPGDGAREDAAEIACAAEKAALLTYQLLAFSRRQILRPKRLSLHDVVTDVSRMLRRMLRRVLGEHISIGSRRSTES